jgi:RNA polymerase sigma factor (TIGR02999 family)
VDVEKAQRWDSRGHFFAAAAEAMRRILVNRARDKKRLKRGGDFVRIDLDQVELALNTPHEELLALDEAMGLLAEEDKVGAELVKLRFFAGLNLRQAAESLGIPTRTADRHWANARAWLYEQLEGAARKAAE